jgi:glutamate-ammonia-ligase adenylyltransferase
MRILAAPRRTQKQRRLIFGQASAKDQPKAGLAHFHVIRPFLAATHHVRIDEIGSFVPWKNAAIKCAFCNARLAAQYSIVESSQTSAQLTQSSRFARALSLSRYASAMLGAHPDWATAVRRSLASPVSREEIRRLVSTARSASAGDEFFAALRNARQQVMLRLLTRDLAGLADLDEVLQGATCLAESAIELALEHAETLLSAQYGAAIGEESRKSQRLLVVGMGKLGGSELNVSSDVDLVFLYPEEGETSGPRCISNHEYFTLVAKHVIAALSKITGEGFVFRVDNRLRPHGESGALVYSLPMLEDYLITQGREWERYAWIKARVIAGGAEAPLLQLVHPFVYRRHLDFSAIGSMRELHSQIRAEAKARRDNIKVGAGGIREIEFIAQVFQLVRGGRDAALRARSTLQVLGQLPLRKLLPQSAADELISCYRYLRNLEHRLQYLDDKQTQSLPREARDQDIIARAMGFDRYDDFAEDLEKRRRTVIQHFEQVFVRSEEAVDDALARDVRADEAGARLARMGYRAADETARRLSELRRSRRYTETPQRSRDRVERLLPRLIKLAAEFDNPDETFARLLKLVETISRREAYLAFLTEFPQAAANVARLLAASPWVADYLIAHPILLDELVDPRTLHEEPDWHRLGRQLDHELDAEDATERQMDLLRHFKQVQVLRLVAQDLAGLLPLTRVSDHLSALADLMLHETLRLTWQAMRTKHRETPRFAIVGYGKLGGKELGYASDLDLIFLYDHDSAEAPQVYARLAQRINSWLSMLTPAGVLYETDLRLRPSGASGLLVSSIAAFVEYQTKHAWIWEHQALTRARYVAGDPAVGDQFAAIRGTILRSACEPEKLRSEVVAMREKMLDAHPNASGLFDLKHDPGGIVDVEFVVQFLVLAHSREHAELTENIGNLALLKLAAKLKLIPEKIADAAHEAYAEYRQRQHKLRLQSARYARVPREELGRHIEAVRTLWRDVFEKNTKNE